MKAPITFPTARAAMGNSPLAASPVQYVRTDVTSYAPGTILAHYGARFAATIATGFRRLAAPAVLLPPALAGATDAGHPPAEDVRTVALATGGDSRAVLIGLASGVIGLISAGLTVWTSKKTSAFIAGVLGGCAGIGLYCVDPQLAVVPDGYAFAAVFSSVTLSTFSVAWNLPEIRHDKS